MNPDTRSRLEKADPYYRRIFSYVEGLRRTADDIEAAVYERGRSFLEEKGELRKEGRRSHKKVAGGGRKSGKKFETGLAERLKKKTWVPSSSSGPGSSRVPSGDCKRSCVRREAESARSGGAEVAERNSDGNDVCENGDRGDSNPEESVRGADLERTSPVLDGPSSNDLLPGVDLYSPSDFPTLSPEAELERPPVNDSVPIGSALPMSPPSAEDFLRVFGRSDPGVDPLTFLDMKDSGGNADVDNADEFFDSDYDEE